MADQPTSPTRITKKQLIVLSVLGVALIAALVIDPSSEEPSRLTDSAASAARRGAQPETPVTAEWKPNWPNIPLAEVLQHNPFATLQPIKEAAAPSDSTPDVATTAELTIAAENAKHLESAQNTVANMQRKADQAIAAFQKQRVKLTVRAGEKSHALIGDRLVHEGEIVDGVRIVSILPSGVLIEPFVEPEHSAAGTSSSD